MTRHLAAWIAPLVVGVVAFAAAWSAMLPGLGYWDTGELQAVAPLMGTAHPTGYPTYVLLGWLANLVLTPLGEPAFRMNVFAGLSVAVAAAVTVDLARTLTRSTPLGVLAGLGFALTPAVWEIGTRAEAHALHLAFLAILLRLLVGWDDARRRADAVGPDEARPDRWLLAASLVFGLSVGNHSLTLLLALPVGLYVLAVEPGILRRPRFIAACALVLAGTIALVFLELPLRAGPFRSALVYGEPHTWDGFWYIVLAQQFQGSFVDPLADWAGRTAGLVERAIDQFGILAAFIPAGLVTAAFVKPRYALLTGTAMAITLFFDLNYENAEIWRYYLGPILIAWTWIAILVKALIDAFVRIREPGHRRRSRRATRLGSSPGHGARGHRDRAAARPDRVRRPLSSRARRRQPRDRGAPVGRRRPRRDGGEGRGRQLVELLDAAMVRTACRRPAAGHPHRGRPHAPRRGPWRHLRRDRRQPAQPPRVRHP